MSSGSVPIFANKPHVMLHCVRCNENRRKPQTSSYTLIYELHATKSFWRSQWLLSLSWSSHHFTESLHSFPYSQKPSTDPYSDPEKSSACPPIQFRPQCSHYQLCLGLISWLLPSDLPTKLYMHICSLESVLHVEHILFSLAWPF
jgi:hypothetical protein